MPDITPANIYMGRLRSAERELDRKALQDYKELRRDLVELLERYPLRDPALVVHIEALYNRIGSQAAAIRSGLIPNLLNTIVSYLQAQYKRLRRAKVPVAPELPLQAEREAGRLLSETLIGVPQWVNVSRERLLSELYRLRPTDIDLEDTLARLTSTTIKDGRASAWRLGIQTLIIGNQLDLWGAANGSAGAGYQAIEEENNIALYHQVIATIDELTTDCCLRAHAQIKPLDAPFHLVGTPRFADYILKPPFHYRCRSAEVLYHPEFESLGLTTGQMEDAAIAEISARAITGRREEIHPSHARSRRGYTQ